MFSTFCRLLILPVPFFTFALHYSYSLSCSLFILILFPFLFSRTDTSALRLLPSSHSSYSRLHLCLPPFVSVSCPFFILTIPFLTFAFLFCTLDTLSLALFSSLQYPALALYSISHIDTLIPFFTFVFHLSCWNISVSCSLIFFPFTSSPWSSNSHTDRLTLYLLPPSHSSHSLLHLCLPSLILTLSLCCPCFPPSPLCTLFWIAIWLSYTLQSVNWRLMQMRSWSLENAEQMIRYAKRIKSEAVIYPRWFIFCAGRLIFPREEVPGLTVSFLIPPWILTRNI